MQNDIEKLDVSLPAIEANVTNTVPNPQPSVWQNQNLRSALSNMLEVAPMALGYLRTDANPNGTTQLISQWREGKKKHTLDQIKSERYGRSLFGDSYDPAKHGGQDPQTLGVIYEKEKADRVNKAAKEQLKSLFPDENWDNNDLSVDTALTIQRLRQSTTEKKEKETATTAAYQSYKDTIADTALQERFKDNPNGLQLYAAQRAMMSNPKADLSAFNNIFKLSETEAKIGFLGSKTGLTQAQTGKTKVETTLLPIEENRKLYDSQTGRISANASATNAATNQAELPIKQQSANATTLNANINAAKAAADIQETKANGGLTPPKTQAQALNFKTDIKKSVLASMGTGAGDIPANQSLAEQYAILSTTPGGAKVSIHPLTDGTGWVLRQGGNEVGRVVNKVWKPASGGSSSVATPSLNWKQFDK